MVDYSKLEFATINDVFERMSHQGATPVAMFKTGNEWKEISSEQMYGRVRALVGCCRVGDQARRPGGAGEREPLGVAGSGLRGAGDGRGGCAAVSDADAGADGLHAARLRARRR